MSTTPTPQPGTRCALHPGRPATTFCTACYRPICEECRDLTAPEPRCTGCSVAEIVAEAQDEQAAKEARKAAPAPNPNRKEWSRYALVAALVVLGLLVIGTFPGQYIKGRTLYAHNRPAVRSPGLNGCLRELWRVRKALDRHLARHGHVPASLHELFDGRTPRCPSCGEPYIYQRQDATHYTVRCPRADVHLVGGVRINSGSAPAILDRPQH